MVISTSANPGNVGYLKVVYGYEEALCLSWYSLFDKAMSYLPHYTPPAGLAPDAQEHSSNWLST